MTALRDTLHDAICWLRGNCSVHDDIDPPPSDTVMWLRYQTDESTERTREGRIRLAERALLPEGDFLDDELFLPPKRKGKRP